jgi:hypothetical protein
VGAPSFCFYVTAQAARLYVLTLFAGVFVDSKLLCILAVLLVLSQYPEDLMPFRGLVQTEHPPGQQGVEQRGDFISCYLPTFEPSLCL